MLERMLVLKEVGQPLAMSVLLVLIKLKGVKRFIWLADDSDAVPNLDKHEYSDYHILASEWTKMELM